MSDPRNAAHDKKVSQEKKHDAHSAEAAAAAHAATATAVAEAETEPTTSDSQPSTLNQKLTEGSVTVLSQLKEMDFHSRATLERLAELMLTVADQLKQKDFSVAIGDLFSAQDKFQTQLTALLEPYQAEVTRLQGEAS